MKTWKRHVACFCTLWGIAFAGGSSLSAAVDVSGHTILVDVSKNVVMLQTEKEYGSNITCVSLDEGLVFVDCSFFTEMAAQFRKDMESRFQKKTLALVLTHGHIDHFFGMGAFADVPTFLAAPGEKRMAAVLRVKMTDQVIAANSRVFPKFGDAAASARLFLPPFLFTDTITLGHEGNALTFRVTGGHSDCCAIGYYAPDGVLLAGDLVQPDFYPYFGDASTDILGWIETLKECEKLEVNAICCGHRRPVDSSYLTSVRGYFEELTAVLKKLKSENVPIEKVAENPELPAGYWGEAGPKPVWFDPAIAFLYYKLQ